MKKVVLRAAEGVFRYPPVCLYPPNLTHGPRSIVDLGKQVCYYPIMKG